MSDPIKPIPQFVVSGTGPFYALKPAPPQKKPPVEEKTQAIVDRTIKK